jgi:hypothetical protein
MKKQLILCVLVLFLVGCSKKMNEVLDNNSCSFPCIYQISPGLTTKDESLSILERLGFVNQINMFETSWQKCSENIEFTIINKNDSNICTDNGLVQSIHISNIKGYLLGEFIIRFGKPDRISCEKSYFLNSNIISDSPHRYVSLYYPNIHGVIILDYTGSGDSVSIQEKNEIYELSFYSDDAFNSIITGNTRIKYYIPWDGYINYQCKE